MTRRLPADCQWFEARLIDLSAGRLRREERDRLNSHARTCRSCGEMWAVSAEAPPRVVPDGDAFTRQVLARTSDVVRRSVRDRPEACLEPRRWFGEWWRAAFLRPRFSLEAAYVGAVLLFSVLSLFPEVPDSARREETLAGIPVRAVKDIGRLASAVPEVWAVRLGTVRDDLSDRAVSVRASLAAWGGHGSSLTVGAVSEGSRIAAKGFDRVGQGFLRLTDSVGDATGWLWERRPFSPNPASPASEE